MNITDYNDQPVAETTHGVDVRKLLDSEYAQVIEIVLEPGEALRKHITLTNVFFYVLEGEGVVEIGNEREIVASDQLIESPRGIPHRLINEGDAPFRFLVVKAPRQTETTRLL